MKRDFSGPVKGAFARILLVLVAATLCASCSREQADVDKPGHSPKGTVNGTSRFLKEVAQARQHHEETGPPAAVPVLKWDFANKDVHSYTYEQEVRNKMNMGSPVEDKSADMGQEMSAKGMLLIKSQGDGTAECNRSRVLSAGSGEE